MKVATQWDAETAGATAGQLMVVSDDLTTFRYAKEADLQIALDHDALSPDGPVGTFNEEDCASPLPRAYAFLDGSAYVNHVSLVRQARGVEMPASFWTDPLMYQGCSQFLAPRADIPSDPSWGTDFEAEVAVITHRVAMGASREEALEAIRYVTLLNDISLRSLIPDELAKGFGFVQSKPACACAPVAVAVENCPGWKDGKLHGVLNVDLNGAPFGRADAGVDMTFDFGELIAHAAKTRDLPAGTIIGSGTVSNRDADGGPGRPVARGGRGYSCIAELRMVETIHDGAPKTPFLKPGDRVDIWMEDETGQSIFGHISQKVAAR